MDFPSDAHNGTTDKARFFQHQVNQIGVGKLVGSNVQLLETGAAKSEHPGGRSSLQQIFDFRAGERVLKKIAIVNFHLLLREKLPRLPAGGSARLTVKVNFHSRDISKFPALDQRPIKS
jgi:hypothetical protein